MLSILFLVLTVSAVFTDKEHKIKRIQGNKALRYIGHVITFLSIYLSYGRTLDFILLVDQANMTCLVVGTVQIANILI